MSEKFTASIPGVADAEDARKYIAESEGPYQEAFRLAEVDVPSESALDDASLESSNAASAAVTGDESDDFAWREALHNRKKPGGKPMEPSDTRPDGSRVSRVPKQDN